MSLTPYIDILICHVDLVQPPGHTAVVGHLMALVALGPKLVCQRFVGGGRLVKFLTLALHHQVKLKIWRLIFICFFPTLLANMRQSSIVMVSWL